MNVEKGAISKEQIQQIKEEQVKQQMKPNNDQDDIIEEDTR